MLLFQARDETQSKYDADSIVIRHAQHDIDHWFVCHRYEFGLLVRLGNPDLKHDPIVEGLEYRFQ